MLFLLHNEQREFIKLKIVRKYEDGVIHYFVKTEVGLVEITPQMAYEYKHGILSKGEN